MASGSANSFAAVEKLSGMEDYKTWKFAMTMLLKHEDLWDYVTDKVITKDPKKDERAMAKICLMVQPSLYVHVHTAKSAKEAWDNLAKTFENRGLVGRLSLLRKLFSVKFEDFSDMSKYVSEIMTLSQKLTDMDAAIDDEFVGVILLSGLPSSFDPLVMTLESSEQKLTSEIVKTKLLMEDHRREKDVKETAFAADGLPKVFKGKCYHCHKVGHIRPNCPELTKRECKYKNANKKYSRKSVSSAMLCALGTNENTPSVGGWYVDSGATCHMSNRQDWMKNYHDDVNLKVTVANNEKVFTKGRGDVPVYVKEGLKTIQSVVYVPELSTNLLSVSKMVEKGHVVVFSSRGCKIYHENDFNVDGDVRFTATNINGVYKLDELSNTCFKTLQDKGSGIIANISSVCSSQELWHKRLGHLNLRAMDQIKMMVTGVNFNNSNHSPCISCIQGKQTKQPFKRSGRRASDLLQLVHTDLCGPMEEKSFGGHRYMLVFIDDFSRKIFVYFLKEKNGVFKKFVEFKAAVENEVNKSIKVLRSDNGGEYINTQLRDFLVKHGIKHQTTISHTPQQNGVAERTNRSICEKARAMMQDANCSKHFWAEASNTAVYLKNRSPHAAVLGKTPEEVWTGVKPDLSHLRIFGSRAMVHIPKVKRQKWDAKSEEHKMVGYCTESKGYRLLDKHNNICKARDVIFLEDCSDAQTSNTCDRLDSPAASIDRLLSSDLMSSNSPKEVQSGREIPNEEEMVSEIELASEQPVEVESIVENRRYPLRDRKKTEYHGHVSYHTVNDMCHDPTSVHDAMTRNDNQKWQEAMIEEYNSLLENKVWMLVDKPKDQNIVSSKWVFKLKRGADGESNRYKARLVARGFTQQEGVDYDETFSPVVRRETIRILFGLAAKLNLEISHLDVKTAFLNGSLEETVYMSQPEEFIQKGSENKVCLLKKAIYGLKQASRMWNKRIHTVLIELGLQQSEHEPCVYFKISDDKVLIVALYVDDFLVFSNSNEAANHLKKELMKQFKMQDLGEARFCLGMKICRDKSTGMISVSQKHYVMELLDRFNMSESKVAKTPMEANLKLLKSNVSIKPDVPYQCLIGSLMYLATCTRPDIAYPVSMLSQFNSCFTMEHWKHAKRVLRYLKGTLDKCLVFKPTEDSLTGYVDADWGSDVTDRHSYSGFVFKFAGAPISWGSKKQKSVALSSTESEYMALSEGVKEAIYLQNLMCELKCIQKPIIIYNDNQSAIKLSENAIFHSRTKHISVRYHFTREAVECGKITLLYMSTSEMIADVLTKALCSVKHNKCVEDLGLNNQV